MNLRNDIFKYLIELLIVAFGVVLGMYVSNWNAEIKTQKKADKTLEYLEEEIQTNINSLTKAIDYHTKLRATFDSIKGTWNDFDGMQPYFKNKTFKLPQIPGWKGPGMISMESSVFEGARMSNILQEFDLEQVHTLNKAYKAQENYSLITKEVVNKIFNIDSRSTLIDAIGVMEFLNYDILGNEKFLKDFLEQCLKKLKDKDN